jgi:hypothetical protein
MGYGDGNAIDNSFGVEFDLFYNHNDPASGPTNISEGSDSIFAFSNAIICHTSYLRNSSITAIKDHNGKSTFKPMKDGYVSVLGQ